MWNQYIPIWIITLKVVKKALFDNPGRRRSDEFILNCWHLKHNALYLMVKFFFTKFGNYYGKEKIPSIFLSSNLSQYSISEKYLQKNNNIS